MQIARKFLEFIALSAVGAEGALFLLQHYH